jgi:hypothetical protein
MHEFCWPWDSAETTAGHPICLFNQQQENSTWRVCGEPIWATVHRRPIANPDIDRELLCLVCARTKPWGIFDPSTGAVVCAGCRDKARAFGELPPAQEEAA